MYKRKIKVLLAFMLLFLMGHTSLKAQSALNPVIQTMQGNPKVMQVVKINPTTVEVLYTDKQRMVIDFYGENIFRLFQDVNGGIIRDPEAKPDAQILVNNPRKKVESLNIEEDADHVWISTEKVTVTIGKSSSLLTVTDRETQKVVMEWLEPVSFEKKKVSLTLKEHTDEYFFGGGVQNGRFSHKGKAISIENQNSWTDGGVASPTPFYWSTKGYGIMWYTFKKGKYDFGGREKGKVRLYHETDYLDVFVMVNEGAVPLLNDFYQLTGHPVLLPKFGFYQGHLNAYNRDYWKEDENGILFEDGKRYKESQKDNGGVKESLNGELGNYQFSARAVIDRYREHDMPLGWLLPNDGYGAGYGQTETLDGNIQNLKDLGDYSREKGVEIGLWTQSDLHPKDSVEALLQRDIVKEVRDAGVRVLKTDVAWVGAGYSFGLNGVADVGHIMPYYGNDARPFIISLDGWAGTQRYAAIWSGDQSGGNWEYIRFHIPTYLGSGLSGQPNITSDMDGIFGGKNEIVNTRDFQWKTFTPMELNMDGWGSNEKYPHALGEPTTSINRHYLKWKSQLMPYAYSIAKEAINGLPMIRAMFLEYPNAYTLGISTQYQFLYGPYFLVAPIYQETKSDSLGNDIRNGIYLPEGTWIDYFTGDKYEGNMIINNFDAPQWKLPVFVKEGAIIPIAKPNNNVSEIDKSHRMYEIYPKGETYFTEYDDDGKTESYRLGKYTTTKIESSLDGKNKVKLIINPTEGDFEGAVKEKSTELLLNVSEQPKKISARVGKSKVKLRKATTEEEYREGENVYYYEPAPDLNKFATKGSDFEKIQIIKNPQLLVKLAKTDVRENQVVVEIEGYKYNMADRNRKSSGYIAAPQTAQVEERNVEAYTLQPTWNKVEHADFYEIDFEGMHYSLIRDTTLLFDGLEAETPYTFKIRSANKDGYSDWKMFSSTTKSNPLEFAIQGIQGSTTVENQGGNGIDKLFDFDEGNMWHTKWGTSAVPFDLIMDLKSFNQLDKFQYLPRSGGGNGILLKGTVYYGSTDEDWKEAGSFEWVNNDEIKVFTFTDHPEARYIKLSVTEGTGGFGSGRELYVFKVPGTESYIPGDINNDRLIDRNDLTSYINYTGLRIGDADFEGYVSRGDINRNGLIDAYDISVVAIQLDGGVEEGSKDMLAGNLVLETAKTSFVKDEIVEIRVKAIGTEGVNALSFALPYNPQDYEYVGIKNLGITQMENLTNDRLHTNGQKALYPTFVNIGNKEVLSGSNDIFVIRFRAKRDLKFNLKEEDGMLVGKNLHTIRL